jgi:hypothetical protein
MELDYQIKPSWTQKWKPVLQNWRLVGFIAALCVPFAWVGYTIYSQTVTKGIYAHGDYISVDLKALGNFPFDKFTGTLNDVPKDFRALDGKRIELVGQMWSGNSAYEASDFQFVYNIGKCCFNGPPLVQERVFVHVRDHARVPLYSDQVRLLGTLHVRPKRDAEGAVISLYDLDFESVHPVSG